MADGSSAPKVGSKIASTTPAKRRGLQIKQMGVEGIDKDTLDYIRMVQSNWDEKEADKFYDLEDKVYTRFEKKAGPKPTTLKGKEEEDAVAEYKQWGFEDLNANLRAGRSLTVKQQKLVKGLDKVMKRAKLTKDTIVFRGGFSHKGADKGYTSTSTNPYQANRFASGGKHLYAYRIPKGTHALTIGGGEEEIVLPRGFNISKYRIL